MAEVFRALFPTQRNLEFNIVFALFGFSESLVSSSFTLQTCFAAMLLFSLSFTASSSLRLRYLSRKNLLTFAPFLAFPSFANGLASSYSSKSTTGFWFPEATPDPTMMAHYDWCCSASINPATNSIDIHKVAGYDNDCEQSTSATFDITSNSQWMEFIEETEDRVNVEGGAGAYDVMRCDLMYHLSENHHPMEPVWKVWGEDFHLKRLTVSYRSLLQHMDDATTSDAQVDKALESSRAVIRGLLMEAHSADIMQSRAPPVETKVNDVTIQLTKLTVLWTPKHNEKGDTDIIVRGHACSSCKPVQIHKRPSPIVATLALPIEKTENESKTTKQESVLPSRFRSPQNKVASWCRLRKPLEDPDTYKPPGVGEVLMVRSAISGEKVILEGLTSNFFVIYKDGTVRTAEKGVLFGYVRHLVIDCVERVGLRMEYSPILMDDATNGLWESAFITSSSRLVYPISRILIPEVSQDENDKDSTDRGVSFREFWTDPALVDGDEYQKEPATPQWLNILNELLIVGGYEALGDSNM